MPHPIAILNRESGGCHADPFSAQRPALPVNMTDLELDQLFASCIPRLRRAARQLLRNPEDCEDALQEGLLLAYKNLRQFQGRSKFSTWLHTIVRNAARTQVRRMKCRPQLSWEEFSAANESALERLTVDAGPTPGDTCESRERSRILHQVMEELPDRYKAVMQLCDVDGVDQKDAAHQLGITAAALTTYLFRARRLATERIRLRYRKRFDTLARHRRPLWQRAPVSEFSRQRGRFVVA